MRTLAQFIGVLLLVGFVGAYFWWIVTAVTVAGLAWLAVRGYRAAQAEAARDARRRAALVARADQQHAWMMAGDPVARTVNPSLHQCDSNILLVCKVLDFVHQNVWSRLGIGNVIVAGAATRPPVCNLVLPVAGGLISC